MSSSATKSIIFWFRNDLRLDDNPGLTAAIARSHEAAGPASKTSAPSRSLLPLFIFPPRLFGMTSFGFPKVGAHRARFLLETLQDLRRNLRDRGSDLLIVQGEPGAVLAHLAGSPPEPS